MKFDFFSEQVNYLYDSFETISSTGKNGAIIHYKYMIFISKDFIFCLKTNKRIGYTNQCK
jgi:Xaa-Pro aminopeptidase